MAISYVGAASAASNSVSLPSFQAGDVAIVLAINSANATIPSLPAGWRSIETDADGAQSGIRVLLDGDTTSGTWTNATNVAVMVWRGVDTRVPMDRTTTGGTYWTTGTATVIATGGVNPTSSGYKRVFMALAATSTIAGLSGGTWTNNAGTGNAHGVMSTDSTSGGDGFDIVSASRLGGVNMALRLATTFPIVDDFDTTSGTVTSNSSSWTLTYPTNIAAGDLLLAFLATDGNFTTQFQMSGWSSSASGSASNTANTLICQYRVADGTETGTFTASSGNSEQGSWIIYRIPTGTWHGTTAPLGSSTATGSPSANPDPPSFNPADWDLGYTLWIAAMSADTSRTVSAYPSSPDTFTNTGSLVSGGSNGATLGYARLEKNASSVDPGTFTISSSDDWVAATIAIRGAARTGGFTADAQIVNRKTGSFAADAYFALAGGPTTQYGSFSANAVLFKNSGTKTLSSDATKLKTQSGSLTADATAQRTQTGSISANATIFQSQSGSITADATVLKSQSGSFTAAALFVTTQTSSLTGDAIVFASSTETIISNAVVLASSGTQTVAANAVMSWTQAAAVAANAIALRGQSGSMAANATIKKGASGSFTGDSIRLRRFYFGSGPDPR